jgi:hypothetical protein
MIIKYEDIDRIINILQEAKSKLKPGQVYKFEGTKLNIVNRLDNENWCVKSNNEKELIFIRNFYTKYRPGGHNFDGYFSVGEYWLSDNLKDDVWIPQSTKLNSKYKEISFEEFKQFANEYKG